MNVKILDPDRPSPPALSLEMSVSLACLQSGPTQYLKEFRVCLSQVPQMFSVCHALSSSVSGVSRPKVMPNSLVY